MPDSAPSSNRKLSRLMNVAVKAGIESAVRLCIERGGDLESRDETGATPLMIAASRDQASICQMLLDAGADVTATDIAGRDALALALAFGAASTADIIRAHIAKRAAVEPCREGNSKLDLHPFASHARVTSLTEIQATQRVDAVRPASAEVVACAQIGRGTTEETASAAPVLSSEESPLERPVSPAPASVTGLLLRAKEWSVNDDSIPELSFGDWEPVDVPEPPQDNALLARAEAERHRAIGRHSPLDRSASWEDFEVLLPEIASPLARAEDLDSRKLLRGLLLRALREGSVPKVAVENALSERGDGAVRDERAERAFEFVLGDLCAEIDERLEFSSAVPSENFEVEPPENETEDEASTVDEALLHFDGLLSGSNEPLRIYSRTAGKHSLLTADQEIKLAKSMEEAVSRALDALACWPRGVSTLLGLIEAAIGNASALSALVAMPKSEGDAEQSSDGAQEEIDDNAYKGEEPESGPASEVTSEQFAYSNDIGPVVDPLDVFSRIMSLPVEPLTRETSDKLRQELGCLNFRRHFLIKLAEGARADNHPIANAYARSIADLLILRSAMVEANLRLVLDMARRHINSGVPMEDLIQDGNIGLLSAVDRFDWRRGYRFSTMATWWIRQSISRGISEKALAIRLPTYLYETVARGRREIDAFERLHGRPASLVERAAMCGMRPERFQAAARAFSEPVTIEDAEREGSLESDREDDPFEHLAAKETSRVLAALLSTLTRKDAEILRQRFGLGATEARTLDQIGATLEVTRERVRQIESKAIRKLSSPGSRRELERALGRTPSPSKKESGRRDGDVQPILDETPAEDMTPAGPAPSSSSADANSAVVAISPTSEDSLSIHSV